MLQAEILGNIGNDAEVKDFSGKKYVSFNVAHSDYGKDQQGNKTETTTWVSVLWYGEGGNTLQYLKKGAKVFVRGRLRAKVYQDKNGNSECSLNINANEVQLCGAKAETRQPQAPTRQAQPNGYNQQDYPNSDMPF